MSTTAPVRRFAAFAAALLSLGALTRGAPAAAAGGDTSGAARPPCPTVTATLDATIDTKRVKAGETFAFTTDRALNVGTLAIPAGTRGVGVIATSDHSKSQGHAGYLVLEARYLQLTDGTHVPVALRPGGDGRSQTFVRAGTSDAGIIGYLPYYIGTAAGIYNVFHHGKDAAVVRGTTLDLVAGDGFYDGTCSVPIDQR